MVLIGEIVLLVVGIMALVKGKLTLSKKHVLYGTPARLVGLIGMAPLPLSFAGGMAIGIYYAAQGKPFDVGTHYGKLALMEIGILISCVVAMYAIGARFAGPPAASHAQPQLPPQLPVFEAPQETGNPFQPPRGS